MREDLKRSPRAAVATATLTQGTAVRFGPEYAFRWGTAAQRVLALSERMQRAMSALTLFDRAARDLAKCTSFDWIKRIQSEVEAAEIHVKSAAMERQCAEIKLRVQRRLGELLAEKTRRGRPKKVASCDLFKLRELGITKSESSRCQAIASLRPATFEHYVSTAHKPTMKDVLQLVQEQERTRREKGPRSGGNILTGDVSRLFDHLDDGSADLILTDPPFDRIDLYEQLAELAAAKLKPGSLCLAFCGQYHLPAVLEAMGRHLQYHWLFAVRFGGPHRAVYAKKIANTWHPVVAFSKGKCTAGWIMDMVESGGKEKDAHEWQKTLTDAEYLIEHLTEPGALVVDPFCGSGTVPAACRKLGRRWLGCELDSHTARVARGRIAA